MPQTEMYFLLALLKQEVQDQGGAGMVSSQASLLGLWMTTSLCIYKVFFCVNNPSDVSFCVQISKNKSVRRKDQLDQMFLIVK